MSLGRALTTSTLKATPARAVRGHPFTLRDNCAQSDRTWQTIFPYLVVLTVTYAWSVFIITFVTTAQMCFIKSKRGTILHVIIICDPWLTPEDVWTTANNVRRRTNFSGVSPARAFVMAHQRASVTEARSQQNISVPRGRGTQHIQTRQ